MKADRIIKLRQILGLSFSVGIIFMTSSFLFKGLEAVVVAPISNQISYLGNEMSYTVNEFTDGIKSFGRLQEKYSELKLENAALHATNSLTKMYTDENEVLKRQLRLGNSEAKLLEGKVVGIDQYTGQNYLLLNQGERDGVKKGQTVVLGNIYIGLVTETTSGYCKVRVPSSGESYLKVKVIPVELDTIKVDEMQEGIMDAVDKYADGVAIGSSIGIKVENINSDYPLSEGQSVIVVDEKVSDWLYLGVITEIDEGAANTSKSAYIKRPVNPVELKFVFIQL